MSENLMLIALPDGRRIGYAQFGRRGGRPVFFMHGFPGSRAEAELLHQTAESRDVLLIAPDRPGFGFSDFYPDRRILDWPGDIEALADALGIDRFGILGGSAGCPYALACVLRLGERVTGLAIVAGLGPATEREAVRRMGAVARVGFSLANRSPLVFRAIFSLLARLVARYPELNFRLNEATPPDKEMLAQPDIHAIFRASIGEAFRQGPAGPVHELLLLARPWGFALEEIMTPLDVWHGLQDGVVPPRMGELLAHRMPKARLHLVAGEGHVSLPVRHGAEILDALLSRRQC